MQRRPWPIVLLAFSQILVEPITNVLLSSRLSHLTTGNYLASFAHRHQWLDLFYLIGLPVVMGVSVYLMKRWSYAIFLAGSLWMVSENVALGWGSKGAWFRPILFVVCASNAVFVMYFLMPQVRVFFLNRRMRWWESQPRYQVEFSVDGLGQAKNISSGGLFLVTQEPPENGRTIELGFTLLDQAFKLRGKVVYSKPLGSEWGCGVQFVQLSRVQSRSVRQLTRELSKKSYVLARGRSSALQDFKLWAHRALFTGRGILPELSQAPAVSVQSQESADSPGPNDRGAA